ncbi:MAG: HAMP domain-containing histidine kinase [Candidatus Marinimicrobia bacterium]|nr:HAMP domain-containing histidine kinase [Candidatus Neomarinimicrobiota bacterium]MBT7119569.1 HAMP domain-containing histidine kinase [Candidatus Neomarinimicrobiota bacterium]MBT7374215.1 HAMP domain-containing histidine kinase [Candidatus Neomarinimicrobiota bacterium]MBT7519914.1 HAMP domain-containing histidine kinase [Candidatus Neomarinimicrobiota bacterium]
MNKQDNIDDEISDSMKAIKQKMEYFISILNELNKMTTSHYIKFEIVNLSTLLDEAIRGVKARIIDKNIAWSGKVNVSIDKTIEIEIDRNQMYEVFVNIIKNGIEAQDMEGNISVIVNAQNEDVIISIQDTGCGIEEYDNDYILDQGITSKQDSGGTGFGLSNAHLFINNHSGDLSWDSTPGEGTVMKIKIPKRQINER